MHALAVTKCLACDEGQVNRGVLCDACVPRMAAEPMFAAQVCSTPMAVGPELKNAWLVDGLGRVHHCSTWPQSPQPITMGRDASAVITIAHLSVSRQHAALNYSDRSGLWYLEDLDSRNGTLLNEHPLARRMPLEEGDKITIGSFAFLFFPLLDADASAMIELELARGAGDKDMTTAAHVQRRISFAPTDGGGGFVVVSAALGYELKEFQAPLSELDFSLLELLAARYRDEANFGQQARGYMRSRDILEHPLPFGTAYPTTNNLRGVVKRIRDKFRKHGMGDIVESTQNLGYRLGYEFDHVDV